MGCISAEIFLAGESVAVSIELIELFEFMILYNVVEFLLVNVVLLSYVIMLGIAVL